MTCIQPCDGLSHVMEFLDKNHASVIQEGRCNQTDFTRFETVLKLQLKNIEVCKARSDPLRVGRSKFTRTKCVTRATEEIHEVKVESRSNHQKKNTSVFSVEPVKLTLASYKLAR